MSDKSRDASSVRLFLSGDVMIGRGIDQVSSSPGSPVLHEDYLRDARDYVRLAEAKHGPIPAPVGPEYIWGEALSELDREKPDARIINLETSITTSDDWVDKGINYRAHPGNIGSLTAANIDVCVLANNHVLDYGPAGLRETLETLARAGIASAGAGLDLDQARDPARVVRSSARVLVFAVGSRSSGIPRDWAAGPGRPGVELLPDLSEKSSAELLDRIEKMRRPSDLCIVSVHWGSNFGHRVAPQQIEFAHRLVEGGVAVVHGHSSHHARPVEVYRDRLILYGCGDLITDYEGISGYEEFRSDLAPMYFVTIDAHSGRLLGLAVRAMQARRFRLERAGVEDARVLARALAGIEADFGARFGLGEQGELRLLGS